MKYLFYYLNKERTLRVYFVAYQNNKTTGSEIIVTDNLLNANCTSDSIIISVRNMLNEIDKNHKWEITR